MDVQRAGPEFRYFAAPRLYSTYTQEPRECHFCRQRRPGYDRPFYAEVEIAFVCEACLAAGRLAEVDASTNEGDGDGLRAGVARLYPGWGPAQVEAYARERTRELEHRTPGLVTWQDFLWPAHCDDYCRFLSEIGKPDLTRLAPDGDGRRFLATHLRDYFESEGEPLWDFVRPDSPGGGADYHTAFYLFECRRCAEPVILWDAS